MAACLPSSRARRTLTVEHVTLVCRRSFEEAHAALQGIVPVLDLGLPELLRHAEAAEIADRPQSFFGQFGDEHVSAVGRELDAELEAALTAAAG